MVSQLGLQPAFQHRLDHLREEAALTGQLQPVAVNALHQPIEQTLPTNSLTASRADPFDSR
jgi:hypothetical protein